MSMTYKAYIQPFSRITWQQANAGAPWFGRLLGECNDRENGTYRLNENAKLGEFLLAIGKAPWLLPDGLGMASATVTIPPCAANGRTCEVTRTFTVKGNGHGGFSGFMNGKMRTALFAVGLTFAITWPLQMLAGTLGSKVFWPIAAALGISASSPILATFCGLLFGIAIILIAVLLSFFSRNATAEQPTMSRG